jgi:hypothetical protein
MTYGFQANLDSLTLVEVPRGEVLDTLMSLWSRVARH